MKRGNIRIQRVEIVQEVESDQIGVAIVDLDLVMTVTTDIEGVADHDQILERGLRVEIDLIHPAIEEVMLRNLQ